MSNTGEEKEAKIRECPHCGVWAQMHEVGEVKHEIAYGDPQSCQDFTYWRWRILLCPSCWEATVEEVRATTFDQTIDGWPQRITILHPSRKASTEELPDRIRTVYEETLRVRNKAPNAFAVMVRRLLEAICVDKCAQGEKLEVKLQYLASEREIPEHLAEVAKKLRLLGNVGAHDVEQGVDQHDIPLIVDFCEALLDYLYRIPARLEALQTGLSRRS